MTWLMQPAAWLYGQVVAARNRRFDAGMRVTDVGVPVISIGNITVGGTGKTPMVQWAVQQLQAAGGTPAIAMRGYLAEQGAASDEVMEHQAAFPDVPVLVGPNRVTQIRRHFEASVNTDVIVLDDGFQHRFVDRALDVVLIDARHDLRQGHLLPRGRMREPGRSLRRADAVVVTHVDHAVWDASAWIEEHHQSLPIASCRHVWSSLQQYSSQGAAVVDVQSLRGMKVATRFGVAHSAPIRAEIVAQGGEIYCDFSAADHAAIKPHEQQALIEASHQVDAIVMTNKDWVKYKPLVDWSQLEVPVLVPQLRLTFEHGETALAQRMVEAAGLESS